MGDVFEVGKEEIPTRARGGLCRVTSRYRNEVAVCCHTKAPLVKMHDLGEGMANHSSPCIDKPFELGSFGSISVASSDLPPLLFSDWDSCRVSIVTRAVSFHVQQVSCRRSRDAGLERDVSLGWASSEAGDRRTSW